MCLSPKRDVLYKQQQNEEHLLLDVSALAAYVDQKQGNENKIMTFKFISMCLKCPLF